MGWFRKGGKDDKSSPPPANTTARDVAAKLAASSGVQKAIDNAGAKVGAELKSKLGVGTKGNNPANDDSGELGLKAAPKTDALRVEMRELLRKKLGILADIKDSGLESNADHQINLPIPISLGVKDGKADPAVIRKTIDDLLIRAGFTDEAKRKKFRISDDGVNWNVPDAVAEQLLPKAEKRSKDFNTTTYLRDNVVREIDGLDLADVVKIKGGFVITGVPGSMSRSKLVEGKANAAELKNKITIDRIVAVDVMTADVMPVLEAYRKEKAAAVAALPKPETPTATAATPSDAETIPLADDTTTPPPAATGTVKPSGNIIPAATNQAPLAIAVDGETPPPAKPPVNQPVQPSSEAENTGQETVYLESRPELAIVSDTLPPPPTPVGQPTSPTPPSKPFVKKWGFRMDGSIDAEAVRVDVRSKLKNAQIDGDHLSMSYDATSRRFVITIHPAQDEAAFRKIIENIASETGEHIAIQETGQMRWLMKQKDLDNWIDGKKPSETHFKIRSDADRLTGLKNFAGLPSGIELKQAGIEDLVAIENIPENIAVPSNARSIKMLKAAVSDKIILRFAGIEDSRER